jgi:Protein of unknown function (DUF1574)
MGPTRASWRRHYRAAAFWMLAAFAASQAVLAVWIDQDAPAVRDPEYVLLQDMLQERIAEKPGKPVAVFLGSSRVALGFDAARAADDLDVLLFNFGVPGSGPFLQKVVLDRMTAAGLRPDVLFIEVLHPFYNAAGTRSLDHSLLDGARLTGREAEGLLHYGRRSTGPTRRWVYARAMPINRHHAELRDLVGLDEYQPGQGPPPPFHPIDRLGYRPRPVPPDDWPKLTELAHKQYDPFHAAFRLDPYPWGRLQETIALAKQTGAYVVVVIMPEGSEFRRLYTPAAREGVADMIRRLREESGVTVVDARDWLDDSAFYDQHHLLPPGAITFADRFREEALVPALAHVGRR